MKWFWKMLLASIEEWMEENIPQELDDFTGMSGETIECNNLQSVSEATELIFGQPK